MRTFTYLDVRVLLRISFFLAFFALVPTRLKPESFCLTRVEERWRRRREIRKIDKIQLSRKMEFNIFRIALSLSLSSFFLSYVPFPFFKVVKFGRRWMKDGDGCVRQRYEKIGQSIIVFEGEREKKGKKRDVRSVFSAYFCSLEYVCLLFLSNRST